MARKKLPPTRTQSPPPRPQASQQMAPTLGTTSPSLPASAPQLLPRSEELQSVAAQVPLGHVPSAHHHGAADDMESDSSTYAGSIPRASPPRKFESLVSAGPDAASQEMPPSSDVSDIDEEASVISVLEGPDATIRPYLDREREFIYYDQGRGAEEPSQGGEAAKEREASEIPEDDEQSILGEDISENTEIAEPVEASEATAISETGDPEVVAELTVLDPVAALDSPKPTKNLKMKVNRNINGTAGRFAFPKFTPVDFFEDYLANPSELGYDTLYHRTAIVAEALIAYQKESDEIEQELAQHEMAQKAEEKRKQEDDKEEAERLLELEDQTRDELERKYRDQLDLPSNLWNYFVDSLKSRSSFTPTVLAHLTNLRNPQFMESATRRRNKSAAKASRGLQDEPIPDYKPTKEEVDAEKRKLGRLLDHTKFDDQKMADVYGFEYSSHPSHYGNQPLDRVVRQTPKAQRKVNGAVNGASEDGAGVLQAGRLRTQRNKSKRLYEVDDSPTSDTEEGRPAKRSRKPRILGDEMEAPKPRSITQNQGPIIAGRRTFPSGKPIGRPPKSKLQAVQVAPAFPDNGDEFFQNAGAQIAQPASLESLASAGKPTTAKPKHAGGRPRKTPAPGAPTANGQAEGVKPRNKGGRPRKNPVPDEALSQDGSQPASQTKGKAPARAAAVKAESSFDAGMVQLGDADDILQSTEQDEGSRFNSVETSGPSSSSSDTDSSFATRRAARTTTRNKAGGREKNGDDMVSPSSPSSSSRKKRKRGTAETEPSPIVVDAPVQFDEPAPKKRRARPAKLDEDDSRAALETGTKNKRKRANTTAADDGSLAKKAKKPLIGPAEFGDDTNHNDSAVLPVPKVAKAVLKVQSEKSRKLSESAKARWASGGMQKAQETRRANLAIKKAAKEAAARAAPAALTEKPSGIAPADQPVLAPAPAPALAPAPAPAPVPIPAPTMAKDPSPKQPKVARQKTSAEPTRPASTRVRKPTRIAAELDESAGDDEEETAMNDELYQQYQSEYDHYQALTSAGSPSLGKRARKPMVDLSAMMGETSEEEYY